VIRTTGEGRGPLQERVLGGHGPADGIHSTEDFIRLAGNEDSMSSKPYSVACPGQPEVASKTWLEAERGQPSEPNHLEPERDPSGLRETARPGPP
jgi:hypothetical protein